MARKQPKADLEASLRWVVDDKSSLKDESRTES